MALPVAFNLGEAGAEARLGFDFSLKNQKFFLHFAIVLIVADHLEEVLAEGRDPEEGKGQEVGNHARVILIGPISLEGVDK